jgi:hypothetical protein
MLVADLQTAPDGSGNQVIAIGSHCGPLEAGERFSGR